MPYLFAKGQLSLESFPSSFCFLIGVSKINSFTYGITWYGLPPEWLSCCPKSASILTEGNLASRAKAL
jgi:hypothetical protein